MVVGKVMRWSPWAPPAATTTTKKYTARIRLVRIDGLPLIPYREEKLFAAVEVEWRRDRKRKSPRRTSSKAAVVGDGAAAWAETPDNEFENIIRCSPDSGDRGNFLSRWDVSFTVVYVNGTDKQEHKKEKLKDMGTVIVNLDELTSTSRVTETESVGRKQVYQKRLPINLSIGSLKSQGMLYVIVSFADMSVTSRSSENKASQVNKAIAKNKGENDEETSSGQASDASSNFDTPVPDISQLMQLADQECKIVAYGNKPRLTSSATTREGGSRSSSGGSSSELQLGSASRRGFLTWGKRRKDSSKNTDVKEAQKCRENEISISANNTIPDDSKEKSVSEAKTDANPIGTWIMKEIISRDKMAKLKTRAFFASIDQRDDSADGESACTALVAVIANSLLLNRRNTPSSSEFDSLIREGSLEWRKLCEDEFYSARFPNKHFDLDTVLDAKVRPISVSSEKSYIGFFQPESFESLRGAMSFDDIWNEITKDDGDDNHPKVYIISWNDHFFVLKVERDEYLVLDTLGERLYEGCQKAYMLKFDKTSEIHRMPGGIGNEDQPELICRGKECCREFIKRFLAAIPLREELELEEKRKGINNTVLHQRLQIEFHLTKLSNQLLDYSCC